jgi:hypothetical protein
MNGELKKASRHYTGEVYAKSYEYIGGKDVMPIGVWSGPDDCMATDKYYCEMKDLGINLLISPPAFLENRQSLERHLNLADKYNMVAYVPYSEKYLPETKEQMEMVHSELCHHPSFVGMTHRDELTYGQIWADYVPVIRAFKQTEYAEKYDYYFNGNPIWTQVLGPQFFCGVSYRTYLKSYVSTKGLGCKFLSADFYPFVGDDDLIIHNYFKQLAVQRDVAYKNKVPFWMYIQCGSICDYRNLSEKTASEAAFRWNVNTTLAYGVKGISWFTLTYSNFGVENWYKKLNENGGDKRCADMQADGTQSALYNRYKNYEHNRWYDYAVRASTHIRAIDEVLMNSYHAGVISYGKSPYKVVKLGRIEGYSWYELSNISGEADLLIGCLEYDGRTALYVVHNSYECGDGEKEATLTFDGEYGYDVYQRAQKRYESGGSIKLKLQGGEGVLVVLK